MTIDRWLTNPAAHTPEKTAISFGNEVVTYGELARRVENRARYLQAQGIVAGDRVAWYGLNHPEIIVLLFAVAKIGAILVPLNWRLSETEIQAITVDCAPKLIFHDGHFEQQAQALNAAISVPLGDHSAPFEHLEKIEENAPVLIVYTSGSTGRPKGVVLTQEAIVANAAMSVHAHEMGSSDQVLCVLPMFHVGGLNILATPALSIGACVRLHERFDPDLACLDLASCDLAIVVPTVIEAIMKSKHWPNLDLTKMRGISIGSTDVPISIIEAIHARGVPAPQIYGATETAPFAIYQTVSNAMKTVGSIGQVGSVCEAKLMGPEGKEVAVNEPGEILIKGPNILKEYWKNNDLTREMIVDGWFKTGDVAYKDESGSYWFSDRIKHIIISGGENIYPAEIERVLRGLPDIIEVSVVGVEHPKWGETPVAVYSGNREINAAEFKAFLEGKIARYKMPSRFIRVDALPRNAMGKIVAADVRKVIR